MHLHFTSDSLVDGVRERAFTLDGIPGVLWTPSGADMASPAPLILLGHPGGLSQLLPRLSGRARRSAADGFATAAIELPGSGDRPRLSAVDVARAELRQAVTAREPVPPEVVDRLILPLVDEAVPELQALLDALLALPEITGPVAYSGGVISIGVHLALVEPRLVAAGLFAGSYVPASIVEEARRVTIPVHVLLQWDDEGNDRGQALDLFDAFGSSEKTLQATFDHGQIAGDTVTGTYEAAHKVFADLAAVGVDFADVTQVLEDEGVSKFIASWHDLQGTVKTALEDALQATR